MSFNKKCALINFLISVLFVLDRLTKLLAFKIPEEGIFLFSEKFIGLRLYKNPNLIFNFPISGFLYALIFLVLAILCLLLIRSYVQRKDFLIFNFSLIIIGALSNLIDRFYFGYVVDFFNFFDYSVFNLSDSYIVIGICFIVFGNFYFSKNKAERYK